MLGGFRGVSFEFCVLSFGFWVLSGSDVRAQRGRMVYEPSCFAGADLTFPTVRAGKTLSLKTQNPKLKTQNGPRRGAWNTSRVVSPVRTRRFLLSGRAKRFHSKRKTQNPKRKTVPAGAHGIRAELFRRCGLDASYCQGGQNAFTQNAKPKTQNGPRRRHFEAGVNLTVVQCELAMAIATATNGLIKCGGTWVSKISDLARFLNVAGVFIR